MDFLNLEKKLAVITSHPIQYNAPLFRQLASSNTIKLKVFYTWGQTKEGQVYDPDFKKMFKWDIPLTDGYDHEFLENESSDPGAGHFYGIKNKDLIEKVKNYKPDAILIFGWSFHSHLKLIRHFAGRIKLFFRGDSTLLDEPSGFSFKKKLRRLFLTWVYRHIDYAIYTGSANKMYFEAHGLRPEKLVYAPHAIENERFYDNNLQFEKKALPWKNELGIKENEIVVLFAGKLEPKKAPDFLVDCFLNCRNPNLKLIITGNGILEEQLKTKASGDKRILFLQFQNQQIMPALYRLADIYILPSRGPGETWGLAVNEAMACSIPVIVTNKVGCSNDLVEHGRNGYIIQSEDQAALTEILNGLHSKETLAGMGGMAKERIVEFNYGKFRSVIERLI
jgi:glycosyltransferase involved in cell wall biosynthesis